MKSFIRKYQWLKPALLFTFSLLLCRIVYSQSFVFLFIPWNIFLAIVPLYFSYQLNRIRTDKGAYAYLALWLLFFPNAMYIVTDLFHLRPRVDVPLWYDLLILLSAAITGVIIGFMSLLEVERFLQRKIPARYVPRIISGFFVLCGYGIYLGRYLRWNSWDILMQPGSLAADIVCHIIHPFRNMECWILTVLFGLWMHIMYRYFKGIKGTTR
jgi:uncharacterized membrane protein